MGAQAPGGSELGPRRRKNEQRRLRATLGESPQQIERGRIGPVQILEREHDGLRARACENPRRQGRKLSAAQFLRRKLRYAVPRERDVNQWRDKRGVSRRIEANQPKRALEVGEAFLARQVRPEPLAAPFGDRVQGRVLQKL